MCTAAHESAEGREARPGEQAGRQAGRRGDGAAGEDVGSRQKGRAAEQTEEKRQTGGYFSLQEKRPRCRQTPLLFCIYIFFFFLSASCFSATKAECFSFLSFFFPLLFFSLL